MTDVATLVKSSRQRMQLVLLAAIVLILALGAVEDVYGNTDGGDVYGSDAVQYLDVARAFERGDFHSAANPLWSQGYPVLLAAARPLFAAGPEGDWHDTRVVNFGIYAANLFAFLFLLFGLTEEVKLDRGATRRAVLLWTAALGLFVTTQLCLGQVSRVNPDELVTTFFFLACGLMVRMLKRSVSEALWPQGLLLGVVLGLGFLVKAVFLALGCGMLALMGVALWTRRRNFSAMLAAAVVFAMITGSYGMGLSRAVGKRTLGEAGSLNYAWHVDRLQKWVHWEGGLEPASEAWPKPWIARLAQWDTRPPDLGKPVHPSVILQREPLVYGFAAPIHATYVPYFDPPYWYTGYKTVVRPRYQLIALAKSCGDLAQALLTQPMFYAVLLALAILLAGRTEREAARRWLRQSWVVAACAVLGVAIYLPVHLEGRYLAGFLALLGMCGFVGWAASLRPVSAAKFRIVMVFLLAGVGGDLARYQRPVWRNLLAHKSPEKNVEWRVGEAVLAQRLPAMSNVGVIAWTPNLHSDWAYIGRLQITSEIGSGQDFDLFWKQPVGVQQSTLETFRKAGAVAVFCYGKPEGAGGRGWTQLGATAMWMYRL